ncbi:MAG TPA: anti-sigma factor [Candidatus Sulfotelmatobacter sp.]|nr:anti-sigma factor [Candidatus Sulfotelmatobacter sp.]
MTCEPWRGKLDAYLDGELSPAEAREVGAHLQGCASCSADALGRVQIKRSVASAGRRFEPSAQLRAQVTRGVAAKRPRQIGWQWKILAVPAVLVLILSVAVDVYVSRERARRQGVFSELADLHVAALATSTPVDVVSSDRHTVKPWFQGKIPFTFNLPELQGSEFTLLGGRVTYLAQTPGAQLIYQLRKHEISVFIFQDRGEETASLASGPTKALSFNIENWTQDGLRYFVVGDVGPDDLHALAKLLRGTQ